MIGAGIGVTPYASILQSIMYRHRNILHECPNCNHSWVDLESQKRALRVKKVSDVTIGTRSKVMIWKGLELKSCQNRWTANDAINHHL